MEAIFVTFAEIPAYAWGLYLVAPLLLMGMVYQFGLPYRGRFRSAIVRVELVSHGIGTQGSRERVYGSLWTEANAITGMGLALLACMGYLIMARSQVALLPVMFALVVLSDLLDGIAARRHDCHSVVGAIIDPLRDRLVIVLVLCAIVMEVGISAWVVPALVIGYFELGIMRSAREALAQGAVLNTHGSGKVRQIAHLVMVMTILVALYLPIGTTQTPALVAVALAAMAVASYRARLGYRAQVRDLALRVEN